MRHSFMLIVSLCVAVGTAQAQQNMLLRSRAPPIWLPLIRLGNRPAIRRRR